MARLSFITILTLVWLPGRPLGAAEVDFEVHIAPSLVNACLDCHRPGKTSGGLDLTTAAGMFKGGDTGPAITPGSKSLLVERITSGEMPPEDEAGKPPRRRPTAEEIKQLTTWITAGAVWPKDRELGLHEQTVDLEKAKQFWSFQPVRRPSMPEIKPGMRLANPIDSFIGAKLAAAGLQLSPRADRRSLLRRAFLDVTGLPPSLTDQDEFLADESPEAYDHLIDRLLASPGYGERWSRHWLDLVRYADSNGYERDGDKPSVWRFRDYVIDSLNADKPYDRFVLEQLAGDELADSSDETIVALGFHALGTWQDEVDPLEAPQYRADEIDDLVRTTSQTFLGITLGCARCHNHKFDPLSMVDYYSLAAILSPLKRPSVGRTDRDRAIGTPQQVAALEQRDAEITKLQQRAEAIKGKSERSDELAQINATMGRLREQTPDLLRAYYLYEDSPQPPSTHLLLSGRAANPGPVMQPRVPAVLTGQQPRFAPDNATSRRRLALAQWTISPENPLTARVIVNRVWQHHFGRGLVATPSDFGDRGARPTHPELLDWLAHWFMHDANWSLKKLHRLILTSETYQASSAASPQAAERDPENLLLSRFPLTRLDVEAIRDSMLAVSGSLNNTMHGPAVYLPIAKEVIEAHTDKEQSWKSSPSADVHRRTVYAYVKRTLLVPMLEVLDLCDVSSSSERRVTTSIAPQALTLYNGDFVNQQATALAERLIRGARHPDEQISLAYRMALSRPPTAAELQKLNSFLDRETAEALRESPPLDETERRKRALVQMCRVIFNLNEFVYPN